MTRPINLLAALLLGTVSLPGVAVAQQYANSPFYEHTVDLSRAYGLESIGLRLDLAAAFKAPYDDELIETIEGVTGPVFARFEGTLEERNPELAKSLKTADGKHSCAPFKSVAGDSRPASGPRPAQRGEGGADGGMRGEAAATN